MTTQYLTTDRTALIYTGPCFIAGFVMQDPAANTITVHDSTTNNNAVFKFQWTTTGGSQAVVFPKPVAFKNGVYVEVTGTSARVTVLLE